MPVGNPVKFGGSNPLRPEDKTRQLSLSIVHEYRNSKGAGGLPLPSLNQLLWIRRQKDIGDFNVSFSIKINTNNDNQFLISKYGFFKFCLMFLVNLKLTFLQDFIFTKCRALTLTEFFYYYRDCSLVSYIPKLTADRAFPKNTSRLLPANFFCKKLLG